MDVFGPLTRTKAGNKYVLVLMHYTSKWPEACGLRNVTTETVVKCLIDMTAQVGIPEEVLTDNGSNFVSKTMREYCTTMGIEQIKTSPYHPQTDGMVERFNATLKRLLASLPKTPKSNEMNAFLTCCGIQGNCAQNHRVLTLPDVIWQTYENAPRPDGQVLEREGRTRTK